MIALYLIFTLVLAVVHALFEIQIEGGDGWGAKLPTWRKEKGLIVKLLGGRPLTGYHVYMILLLLLMFHFPIFFTNWQLSKELLVLGLFLELLLLEDFFWFLFNPHYGLKRFKRGEIWWHSKWLGPVPTCYWWYAIGATLLITGSQIL